MPSTLDSARVDFTPRPTHRWAITWRVTGALIDLEEHLNALDAKVGDGDTGSTFAAGARDCRAARASAAALNDLPTLFADRRTPDGGDGRLQRGIDVYLLHRCRAEAGARRQRGRALNAGLEQMKFYGGADEGNRTMIDALQPAWRRCWPNRRICRPLSPRRRPGRIAPASQAKPAPDARLSQQREPARQHGPRRPRWRWCLRRWRNAKPSPVALRLPGRRNTAEKQVG